MSNVAGRVQAAYDQLADVYAKSNHGAMPADLERLAGALLTLCVPAPRVIDIGCGTGRDIAWFEAKGAEVVGVDRSAGMLNLARQFTHGRIVKMDARSLGLCDSSFDAAWCCASLLHLTRLDAPKALAEIRRVLKTGAPFVLSMQEGDGERWETGYGTDIERFFCRYRSTDLQGMLDAAGFNVIESQLPARTWLTFLGLAR